MRDLKQRFENLNLTLKKVHTHKRKDIEKRIRDLEEGIADL